ncbi:pleckstrin homology domain-containing family D member 1-like isoform X2 [Tubulanus polymorphus]|uniref:pleckstrin homology domain-containing family D member 1-like isoform X2 n=1 Tax=Tubulanus polymorphus TaxID=672921 RepID=UPI003DA4A508
MPGPGLNDPAGRGSVGAAWGHNSGTFDIRSKTQVFGVLMKRPFGHQSTKWSKRFFVVKDGFLLYYADSEKKEAEKRRHFNIHPKGVIPLDGCTIESAQEPGHPYVIYIKSNDFLGDIVLSTDTEWEQEKWITQLQNAGRITWKNAKIGDDMIAQLENQGLKMAQEKQIYFDKFQSEAIAHQDEKERAEELEQIKMELEKEKAKMEQFMGDLREEAEQVKQELEETAQIMATLEQEKHAIRNQKTSLQDMLTGLGDEKEKIIKDLNQKNKLTRQLTQEKLSLSETTESLSSKLKSIEQETQRMLEEKAAAEEKLLENEKRTAVLVEEKRQYNDHAESLQATIKDLVEQKKVTETELRDEVIARLETEKRLQDAEESLRKLESMLDKRGTKYTSDEKECMIGNVRKLQAFFEDMAKEAKLDDNKPLLLQTTISARKTFLVRTKSRRFYEKRRKRVQSMIHLKCRHTFSEGWAPRNSSKPAKEIPSVLWNCAADRLEFR